MKKGPHIKCNMAGRTRDWPLRYYRVDKAGLFFKKPSRNGL